MASLKLWEGGHVRTQLRPKLRTCLRTLFPLKPQVDLVEKDPSMRQAKWEHWAMCFCDWLVQSDVL